MNFSEFLKQFKSAEDLGIENLESFLDGLRRGILLKNDDKYRIEFWHVTAYNKNPVAWITYEALAHNPEYTMKKFVEHLCKGLK